MSDLELHHPSVVFGDIDMIAIDLGDITMAAFKRSIDDINNMMNDMPTNVIEYDIETKL